MSTTESRTALVAPGAPTPGEDRCNQPAHDNRLETPMLLPLADANSDMPQAIDNDQANLGCPSWCTDDQEHVKDTSRADLNCWGQGHPVVLHLEHHAPSPNLSLIEQLSMDPPWISPCAYRRWHALPIVYLHIYRPHENQYLDLDVNLKLTTAEARDLATNLVAVAEQIDGAR